VTEVTIFVAPISLRLAILFLDVVLEVVISTELSS